MPAALDSPPERFGLARTVIERINRVFAGFPSIEKAILYGSRAKGNYRPGSDIDLTLVGAKISAEELLELDSRLEDLLLPYTIDLSRFDAIRNPDLVEHIERVGIVFYPAPG